jgi:hypothetical protein
MIKLDAPAQGNALMAALRGGSDRRRRLLALPSSQLHQGIPILRRFSSSISPWHARVNPKLPPFCIDFLSLD